jgi:hypothetical protein
MIPLATFLLPKLATGRVVPDGRAGRGGSSPRVFVAIRGGDAIALGEFSQPQPHRRHFGKQSFILRRAR